MGSAMRGSMIVRKNVGSKFSASFTEIFNLMMNTENPERKSKQSLFKGLIA
jgi:hypothetical protein